MTSVAICTYNGAKYIERQLLSILSQTHPIDEIVLIDDNSKDGTLDIISGIQSTALKQGKIKSFVVVKNDTNIGVVKNFQKALKLCSGDIIFLSDQDDEWDCRKVESILSWFDANPGKEVVFTDGQLIDDESKSLDCDRSLFDILLTKSDRKWFDNGYALELFLRRPRAVGATMAMRKDLLTYCDFEVNYGLFHDGYLSCVALSRGSLGYSSEKMTRYRIHAGQVCGLGEWVDTPLPKCDLRYSKFPHLAADIFAGNKELFDRFLLAEKRYHWAMSIVGPLKICAHLPRYFHCYGKYFFHFMNLDIKTFFVICGQKIKRISH